MKYLREMLRHSQSACSIATPFGSLSCRLRSECNPTRSFQKKYVSGNAQERNALKEMEILQSISIILEPTTGNPLVELGMIQDVKVKENMAVLSLNIHVPGYPLRHVKELTQSIKERVQVLDGIDSVRIDTAARTVGSHARGALLQSNGLSEVAHVIGVSSCKGGVGKSTVAVNVAASLARMGLNVGILDADVYGPSLPHMLEAADLTVKKSPHHEKYVLPLVSKQLPNLKFLSFGHVNPNSGAPGAGGKVAAVVRGPIATRIINQLLLATDWGPLDYLIIDMPPGTGDVQLTLSQSAAISGVVVVTTPHDLSVVDAAKGIAMFEDLKIPILALVENMSYFECEHGKRYHPFGKGGRAQLLRGFDVLRRPEQSAASTSSAYNRLTECPLHCLPLETALSQRQDGTSSEATKATDATFNAIAEDCILELFKIQMDAFTTPSVSLLQQKKLLLLRYFTATEATEYRIPVLELRLRDPITGKLLSGVDITQLGNLEPVKLQIKGRYGVAVLWSDGHFADIFPFDVLRRIAEECKSAS